MFDGLGELNGLRVLDGLRVFSGFWVSVRNVLIGLRVSELRLIFGLVVINVLCKVVNLSKVLQVAEVSRTGFSENSEGLSGLVVVTIELDGSCVVTNGLWFVMVTM